MLEDAGRGLSQSFSRSYGSILPTSLIYIVLSTRGCSPWRPAAVMSTTWLESYSFPRIFKGRRERTGPSKSAGLYQMFNRSSRQTDFTVVICAGMLTGFPFEGRRTSAHFKTESALEAVRPGITPKASSRTSTPAYSPGHRFYPGGESFAPIRKFDDRFARQNRCEPPPEFPLASPYSRIVHHLSGPNSYAPTQIHPKTSGSVDDAPSRVLTSMLDSLVRVSRRVACTHYASILAGARSSVPVGGIAPRAITLPEGSYVPKAFVPPPEPMLACAPPRAPGRSPGDRRRASLGASASLSTISRTV
ncbi:unnamed protein product [Diplocarpon coronariae]